MHAYLHTHTYTLQTLAKKKNQAKKLPFMNTEI